MKTRIIYLGRGTVGASGVDTGTSTNLANGDPLTGLTGYVVKDVWFTTRTTPTRSGSVTMALQTSNGTALTTAADLSASNATLDRAQYKPLTKTLGASDLGTAKLAVAGGSAGDKYTAGVLDVYAEVYCPLAS